MTKITKEELNNMIENSKTENKIIILKFEADWCGPCKALGPILDGIAGENKELQVVKINVDENSELSTEYGIRSIPSVYIYKAGELKTKFVGLKSKDDILKLLSE